MITEAAMLQVKPGLTRQFEQSFREASPLIASIDGYLGHELQHCMEDDHKYLLIVRWRSLEDHTVGFRESAQYQKWKALLHHYYSPFPVVEHYTRIILD
ncbi:MULTISPECIES: antibiotic biosynthesis monooxygenase family protein [Paenibacillus]|jgi:heme-degrading monooxygenase HmoA|uniref:Antibiotic biosynthesis monooxygenase n=1 Tax=Paenibacillus phytohabitans TaxID=2654978 RepID=A0ABX1YMP4_9BACL|nr:MULTISPECIES: antibiotic biosynthesis monooxygenase [Paenibacillus]AIQ27334.1 antibiotic biosynthesis monooxygenase [Paenibacillus sp. FSL P4-0081]KHL92788.1 antibiotic biosynthesis monooxygenase [Paenibacillus sp. IHB B 3415]NOU82337.1 antibiotic biosynthesis monooxygenase [Paenibacillus phytohabitans]OMF24660.1 antibiotic biosynthesis monooxygenase [Paenibacillus sp. FSL H8-0259]